jgi:ribose/xylose/arabinose/galactoside ABC-type transport system permease subunit
MSTETQQAKSTPAAKKRRRLSSSSVVINSATALAFVALFIFFEFFLKTGFLVPSDRILNIHQYVPVLIIALGCVVGLSAGAFDLSLASMATLSVFLTIGLTSRSGWPIYIVLPLVVVIGCLGGLINGILVAYIKINVIIATLGTGSVFLGVSIVYSSGGTVSAASGRPLPQWFMTMGVYTSKVPPIMAWLLAALSVGLVIYVLISSKLSFGINNSRNRAGTIAAAVIVVAAGLFVFADLGAWFLAISWLVLILIVLTVLVYVFMQLTVWGRNLRSVGYNPTAARLAGLPVQRITLLAFVVNGLLASLAGILLASNQGSAAPNVAGAFLLPAFAAAFLSTVILSPGLFTVWGTVIGGIFVVWVGQGLILAGVPFTWNNILNGLILVVAVSISSILRRLNS